VNDNTGFLHHVNIKVADLKTTTEFWSWFLKMLGWELFDTWPKGVSFKLGPTYVDFVQADAKFKDIPHERDLVGLNHFAFHARTRAHVDEITSALKERGANILYLDQHPFAGGPEYYAVYFEDPNKFKVEVVAPE
jgi:catechol 2,3-dioxygenase-like lactoylglutathione lyase family enzyme